MSKKARDGVQGRWVDGQRSHSNQLVYYILARFILTKKALGPMNPVKVDLNLNDIYIREVIQSFNAIKNFELSKHTHDVAKSSRAFRKYVEVPDIYAMFMAVLTFERIKRLVDKVQKTKTT